MSLETLGCRNLLLRSILVEHGLVGCPHVDTGNLYAGSGETKQVATTNPEGHGWKAGGSAVVLGQFLIEADVALGIIMGEDGSHPAQEDGNALVPTRESMVEVLKNGKVLTVLFERFESFGHFVVWPGLVYVREKGFLVDAVIIGKTYEALTGFPTF